MTLRSDAAPITPADVDRVGRDHTADPAAGTLHAEVYTAQRRHDFEQSAIFARSWQWVCHRERLAAAGDYVTTTVAGLPIAVVRGDDGELRAFYNVCEHRAHEILVDVHHFQCLLLEAYRQHASIEEWSESSAPAEPAETSQSGLFSDARDDRRLLGDGGLPVREYLGVLPEGIPLSLEIRSRRLRERYPDATERAARVHTNAIEYLTRRRP